MQTWSRFIPMGALAVLAALPVLGADKLTPEIKQEQERLLAQATQDLNESCETKITVAIDWKTLEGVDLSDHSPSGFCAEPIKTLASICENSEAKKARVKEKVKAVTCIYAGKASESEQVKEKEIKEITGRNGTLVWRFSWNATNVTDYMIEFFKSFL